MSRQLTKIFQAVFWDGQSLSFQHQPHTKKKKILGVLTSPNTRLSLNVSNYASQIVQHFHLTGAQLAKEPNERILMLDEPINGQIVGGVVTNLQAGADRSISVYLLTEDYE